MKDWPHKLRISAEAVDLAADIYYHRWRVYGGQPAFGDLSPQLRRPFIEMASSLLDVLRPEINPVMVVKELRSRGVLRLVK